MPSRQRTIKFINDEASSIHGNLRVGSVYTSESGEWKLGGFEILSNVKDDDAIIYVRSNILLRAQENSELITLLCRIMEV